MRLSSHDASFIYTETASGPMHSLIITVLDGPATFNELFDYYAARIHLLPRLRQKLVFVPFNLAHPKWVDDANFRLENHLKRHEVPPNTSIARARRIALKLGEPLLDRTRPLWLLYVMENVEGKTLMVQMSHHAFVDGATAIAMLIVFTDTAADAPPPATETPKWRPAIEPTAFELLTEAQLENVQNLGRVFRGTGQDADLARKGSELMVRVASPVMQAPWNAATVGPERELATLEYRPEEFRSIRKALGGTVNDIVVTVVGEGAARYLKSRGEQVDNQRLRLMCPVDVRSEEENPLEMRGNRVSAMFPVIKASPLPIEQRYAEVRAELDGIKARREPETLDRLQQSRIEAPPTAMAATLGVGTAWDPTAFAARFPQPLSNFAGPRPQHTGFNFTCSNVPGPDWTQYVAGYEVVSVIGTMMLGGNLGLGVSFGSFNGRFVFGFTVDPRLLPDVDRFAGQVAEAFAELTATADRQGDHK